VGRNRGGRTHVASSPSWRSAIGYWQQWSVILTAVGLPGPAATFAGYAATAIATVRNTLGSQWYAVLGMHAAGDAVNAGFLTAAEKAAVLSTHFNDSTTACSLSNFNQYWLALALAGLGDVDRGVANVHLCWGPTVAMGGTTFWEITSPDWAAFTPAGDMVPNGENGYTSLCHPWSAGPVQWLSANVVGVRHLGWHAQLGRLLVAPHVTPGMAGWVSGTVPVGSPTGGLSGVVNVTVAPGSVRVTLPAAVDGTLALSRVLLRRIGWDGVDASVVVSVADARGAIVAHAVRWTPAEALPADVRLRYSPPLDDTAPAGAVHALSDVLLHRIPAGGWVVVTLKATAAPRYAAPAAAAE
jgi:alpha-L-rhamnosidase